MTHNNQNWIVRAFSGRKQKKLKCILRSFHFQMEPLTALHGKHMFVLKDYINFLEHFNPFTARMLHGVLWGDSNFWVCRRNSMMWPFKWKLSSCTYTWCYICFSKFHKMKFGHLVGSGRVKIRQRSLKYHIWVRLLKGERLLKVMDCRGTYVSTQFFQRSHNFAWDWKYRCEAI